MKVPDIDIVFGWIMVVILVVVTGVALVQYVLSSFHLGG